jgi:Zn-dependent peptidase ImmA (M78 family)
MILTQSRQKEIDLKIDRVFLATQTSYPESSLLSIVQRLGIKVFSVDFKENSNIISGAVHMGDKDRGIVPQILINSSQSKTRKVFTIAHELGHYILHKKNKFRLDKYNYQIDSKEAKDETEANYFAAALLMPKDKFVEILGKSGDIEATARYFGVSQEAAINRLRWIRINN